MDDMNHLENDHVYVVFWYLLSLHAWHELRMVARIRLQIIDAVGQQQHRQMGMASNSIQFRGTYFGFLDIEVFVQFNSSIQLQVDPAAIIRSGEKMLDLPLKLQSGQSVQHHPPNHQSSLDMRDYACLCTASHRLWQIDANLRYLRQKIM